VTFEKPRELALELHIASSVWAEDAARLGRGRNASSDIFRAGRIWVIWRVQAGESGLVFSANGPSLCRRERERDLVAAETPALLFSATAGSGSFGAFKPANQVWSLLPMGQLCAEHERLFRIRCH